MSGTKTRCNWDERPAVVRWECQWPGATVWLCKFCYGDWAHRACLAPTVLWPARVKELEPGYEAFLDKVRRETLAVGELYVAKVKVPRKTADLLKRKYGIEMEVSA